MGKKKKKGKLKHGHRVIGKILESFEDEQGIHCVFEITDKEWAEKLTRGNILWW
jgi:hypothetical protein